MQDYISVSREVVKGIPIYAFDKIDGSQIRAEWNKKNMFWKFGTRTQLLDPKDERYGEAVGLIKSKYEKDLHDRFVKERYQKALCYFEFWGKNSFAGNHEKEEYFVTIFDLRVHPKGIMPPKEFLRITEGLDRVQLLYHGNANDPFVEEVQEGRLGGMTFEGVVCKSQQMASFGIPLMFKVKNRAWLEKLKTYCKGDDKLFEKLA